MDYNDLMTKVKELKDSGCKFNLISTEDNGWLVDLIHPDLDYDIEHESLDLAEALQAVLTELDEETK